MSCQCCSARDPYGVNSQQPALSGVALLLLLGLGFCSSLILLILAGVLENSWLPFLNLGAIIFLPIVAIMFDTCGSAGEDSYGYDEKKAAWTHFGGCFGGLIFGSMVGLPAVLAHSGVISLKSLGYWLGSTGILFISTVLYFVFRPQ